jgi:CrcB protein
VSPGLWLALAAVGAVGAVARYLTDALVDSFTGARLPYGTFAVNMTGSLVFGLVSGLALYHAFPATPKVLLGTGLCGSFTTFSTLCFETVLLAEEGERRSAAINIGVNLAGGMLAAAIGLALAAL